MVLATKALAEVAAPLALAHAAAHATEAATHAELAEATDALLALADLVDDVLAEFHDLAHFGVRELAGAGVVDQLAHSSFEVVL